jgi:hypothetical protein
MQQDHWRPVGWAVFRIPDVEHPGVNLFERGERRVATRGCR